METINKALDSASHAIWGETHPQHQEPLSGVQGKGKVTDPYDAGNRDSKLHSSHECDDDMSSRQIHN